MLTRRGYGVLEALDGRTGLEIAISQLPDLILLDDIMPGLDGFENIPFRITQIRIIPLSFRHPSPPICSYYTTFQTPSQGASTYVSD